MKPVFEKLQLLEIFPDDEGRGVKKDARSSVDVTDRIIRRAEELRKSWAKGNGEAARSSTRASSAVTA